MQQGRDYSIHQGEIVKNSAVFSVVLALSLSGLAASAQAGNAVADVDVHVSTLGGGVAVAFPVGDTLDARLGFNAFSRSFSHTTTNQGGTVNNDARLKLATYELLADWHLFNGITHLTAGVMYNNNKVELNAVGSYVINGTTYNTPMNAAITFNKVAPYLGFGWSGQAKNTGWSFKSDIGVLFQGAPKATLTAPGVAAADLATQEASVNDSLKNFKYYPVVSFGIGYAF